MKYFLAIACLTALLACNDERQQRPKNNYPAVGSIERLDPDLDVIVSAEAKPEIIAEGMEWSEGPVWVESHQMLLFSDVPRDTVYKWTEANGKEVYLTPSGYTGTVKRGGEMGSNGLLLDKAGQLVLCQCGNRQMARMDAPLDQPAPKYTSLADRYNGKRFDSPNDAVYNSKGELFFTDPPYGLEGYVDDPKKEAPYQGVYKVKTTGEVVLLLDSITRPNGIAFLPGEKKLLIANSDPDKPYWYMYDAGDNDSLYNGTIFYSAAGHEGMKGLPDGLKVDRNGNVFASGPGGIWIFNSKGKLLGKIRLPEAASNCALSPDEKTLYITNDMYIVRVTMRD